MMIAFVFQFSWRSHLSGYGGYARQKGHWCAFVWFLPYRAFQHDLCHVLLLSIDFPLRHAVLLHMGWSQNT